MRTSFPLSLRWSQGIRAESFHFEGPATTQKLPDKGHGTVSDQLDSRIHDAEAAIARQRQLIVLYAARHEDATSAKSLLSAMQYSLKVLKRHLRSTKR
jgi:hypothetical protein